MEVKTFSLELKKEVKRDFQKKELAPDIRKLFEKLGWERDVRRTD